MAGRPPVGVSVICCGQATANILSAFELQVKLEVGRRPGTRTQKVKASNRRLQRLLAFTHESLASFKLNRSHRVRLSRYPDPVSPRPSGRWRRPSGRRATMGRGEVMATTRKGLVSSCKWIVTLGFCLLQSREVKSFVLPARRAIVSPKLHSTPIASWHARQELRVGLSKKPVRARMSLDAPQLLVLASSGIQDALSFSTSKLSSLTYEEIAGGLFGVSLFPVILGNQNESN